MTTLPQDLTQLRNLMQVEIEAATRYRREKAERFLELTRRGVKMTEAWQTIAADDRLLELERRLEEAKADRLVAWLGANRVSFPKEALGFDSVIEPDADF